MRTYCSSKISISNNCAYNYLNCQEDILEGILTVRENLEFSAALRLPRQVTRKERKERVETIIEQLGLTSCANTVVSHLSMCMY